VSILKPPFLVEWIVFEHGEGSAMHARIVPWSLAALLALSFLISPVQGGDLFKKWRYKDKDPEPCQPRTLEELAVLIDKLDQELFQLGTVAVKVPDVWGQNRMTSYRVEFEKEMATRVDKFQEVLNAAQFRSDIAVLTSASSLGLSVGPAGAASPAAAPAPGPIRSLFGKGAPRTVIVNGNTGTPMVAAIPPSTPASAPASSDSSGTTPPNAGDPDDMLKSISDRIDKLSKDVLKMPASMLPKGPIGLEPTIDLDERARYLYHLQELRRTNEGDDLTDRPGYGLYLVRTPVTILPGPASRQGKGAVVTFEAEHRLTPDLLPQTFRTAVLLDAAYVLNQILIHSIYKCDMVDLVDEAFHPNLDAPGTAQIEPLPVMGLPSSHNATFPTDDIGNIYELEMIPWLRQALNKDDKCKSHPDKDYLLESLLNQLKSAHRTMRAMAMRGVGPFGPQDFADIEDAVLARDYERLRMLRHSFLVRLIAARGNTSAKDANEMTEIITNQSKQHDFIQINLFPTEFLMYAIVVQSAIAQRQLREDMVVAMQRKGLSIPDPHTLWFSALCPDDDARMAFNAYVEAKWPIHVFTLDPIIQQQNMLDALSLRSELQLAFAVAIASGKIDFKNATKYARQLSEDLATIGLNRTGVGIGAGETTFGWRFSPRIQTPPTRSQARTIADMLAWGGQRREFEIKHRQIEPGQWDCYALLVMPNFVPMVHLTSFAGWYDLTGPCAQERIQNRDIVRLSRQLQTIRTALNHVCDTQRYRPSELDRLARRVTQLEALLPSQDFDVSLPDEGDLSGSEIFNSDLAHLAPALLSWTGAPAKEGEDSWVFLLGTHFDVRDSKVVAGGVAVDGDNMQLMSRNVMRIKIPKNARTEEMSRGQKVFEIHVASPNGISNHLYVDATATQEHEASKSAYSIDPDDIHLSIPYHIDFDTATRTTAATVRDPEFPGNQHLRIKWTSPTGSAPRWVNVVFHFNYNGGEILIRSTRNTPVVSSANGDHYEIGPPMLQRVAQEYIAELHRRVNNQTSAKPLPTLTSVSIDVTPVATNMHAQQTAHTTNQLTIIPRLTNARR
jgi:hypothetical protein